MEILNWISANPGMAIISGMFILAIIEIIVTKDRG
jgi:hypothetical protein